jgi:hypothetical protein
LGWKCDSCGVECLLSKCEALNLNSSTIKTKKIKNVLLL